MTEYGKEKCELLERNGFKANDLVFWVNAETENQRTYGFVKKEAGSEVGFLTIKVSDDIVEINEKYRKILESLEEYKDYLKTECESEDGSIPYCDAETSNVMDGVGDLAYAIDRLNQDAHDIEEGLPWSEVSDIFDSDDNDEWYLKDDSELFGEED